MVHDMIKQDLPTAPSPTITIFKEDAISVCNVGYEIFSTYLCPLHEIYTLLKCLKIDINLFLAYATVVMISFLFGGGGGGGGGGEGYRIVLTANYGDHYTVPHGKLRSCMPIRARGNNIATRRVN